MTTVKMVTLNVEGDKHLDSIISFLLLENPDVVCLQEVFEKDVDRFKKELSMEGHFVPCMYINEENIAGFTPGNVWGVMILTNLLEYSISEKFYFKPSSLLPKLGYGNPNAAHRVLLMLETKKDNTFFRITTTHFTWTPDAKPLPLQYEHMTSMLAFLSVFDDYVLCGDFNAPRGGEIWNILAKNYHDAIPEEIMTTLDPELHRTKNLQLVVDGIFSTPGYTISDVRVVHGLSDHLAVTAILHK